MQRAEPRAPPELDKSAAVPPWRSEICYGQAPRLQNGDGACRTGRHREPGKSPAASALAAFCDGQGSPLQNGDAACRTSGRFQSSTKSGIRRGGSQWAYHGQAPPLQNGTERAEPPAASRARDKSPAVSAPAADRNLCCSSSPSYGTRRAENLLPPITSWIKRIRQRQEPAGGSHSAMVKFPPARMATQRAEPRAASRARQKAASAAADPSGPLMVKFPPGRTGRSVPNLGPAIESWTNRQPPSASGSTRRPSVFRRERPSEY